jgi:hypothetical protein
LVFNFVNATPVFAKVALPNYEFSFTKIENQKLESEVKIGVVNFARNGISKHFQVFFMRWVFDKII